MLVCGIENLLLMIKDGKLTLLSKILMIFPSAIILFIVPKYAFIYLIVCSLMIFLLERYLKASSQEEEINNE